MTGVVAGKRSQHVRALTTEPPPQAVIITSHRFLTIASIGFTGINGYVFDSLELRVCLHEVAAWHVLSVGAQTDFLSVFFSGHTFRHRAVYADTLTVFPHSGVTVFMSMDNPGWLSVSVIDISYRY